MSVASSGIKNWEQQEGPTSRDFSLADSFSENNTFNAIRWDQSCAEPPSSKHNASVPKKNLDVAAQQPLPVSLSLTRNVFKPAKKAADHALCWLLDIERNPKKPISIAPGESAPTSLRSTTHTIGLALNGFGCTRFSTDDEATNEFEPARPVQSGHDPTHFAPCSGGIFSTCARQQDEIIFNEIKPSRAEENKREVEELIKDLFRLHDLNKNGFLEEAELIQLNKKIAMLHSGKDVDKVAVTEKYQTLFRSQLDPTGRPVSYQIFANYMHQLLDDIDTDLRAQIMMMEQFVSEADTARKFFRVPSFESKLDAPFVRYISFDESIAKEPADRANQLSQDCEEPTDHMHGRL